MTLKHLRTYLLICSLLVILQPLFGLAQQTPDASKTTPATQRDGQHDFDFNLGTWKTHIRYLSQPATGPTWVEFDGIVLVRKVWDGRAQLEEIEADGSAGHFEGLTLFLYNPESHQWSQNFANSNDFIGEEPPTLSAACGLPAYWTI